MFGQILLPVDLNDTAASARAIDFAKDYAGHAGATIHLLAVVPDFSMSVVGSYFPEDFESTALSAAKSSLQALSNEHFGTQFKIRHIVAYGRVYEQIIKAAETTRADLIVVCSGARDLKDYLLGTNAARVVRHATASVMVIR